MDYNKFLIEMKRVRKMYSKKELPHMEAIPILKNLCDLYGMSLWFDTEIELRNHV